MAAVTQVSMWLRKIWRLVERMADSTAASWDQHLGAVTVVLHHLFDGFEVPDGARKAVADLFRLLGVMDMPMHMGVPVAVLMDVFVLDHGILL